MPGKDEQVQAPALESTADKLRFELIRIQMENLKQQQQTNNEGLRLQLVALEQTVRANESRLRAVEEAATKFNFLLYLTMGGGLVGLINLGLLAFTLLRAMTP